MTQASGFCTRTCESNAFLAAGCCDTLWLPHIDMPNLLSFDYQANQPRWRIWIDALDNKTVHWSTRLDATWFSPFDFRAWPLEHQHLLMEFQLPASISSQVSLALGSTAPIQNAPHVKGVDLAGWWVLLQGLYGTLLWDASLSSTACKCPGGFQRQLLGCIMLLLASSELIQPAHCFHWTWMGM